MKNTILMKWKQYFLELFKVFKNILNDIRKVLDDFSKKYPNISQNIQLTFIYFFAVIDLIYSILNNVFALGYFPELIMPVYPLIEAILLSPFFRIWASPEKVFFMSYLIIELMIVRSAFNVSKLVKYNTLLLFALLMLQGLAISYWDILFHREIVTNAARWAFDKGVLMHTDKPLAIQFFLNTFYLFLLGYIYLYSRAIQGKFATLPYMEWLTDSIAFWLRIKTPTMRVGKRKTIKKNSNSVDLDETINTDETETDNTENTETEEDESTNRDEEFDE